MKKIFTIEKCNKVEGKKDKLGAISVKHLWKRSTGIYPTDILLHVHNNKFTHTHTFETTGNLNTGYLMTFWNYC